MSAWIRTGTVATAAVMALTGVPAFLAVVAPPTANADVCASAGRRISVGGCANLSDVMAPYVPPPEYYAPMPADPPPPDYTPNVSGCVGWNGRWVNASGCR